MRPQSWFKHFFPYNNEQQALLPATHAATQQVNERLQRVSRNDRLLEDLGADMPLRHLAAQEKEWQSVLDTLLDAQPPLLTADIDASGLHLNARAGTWSQTQALARLGELLLEQHQAVGLELFAAGATAQRNLFSVPTRADFLRRCLQAMDQHPWATLTPGALQTLQIQAMECFQCHALTLEEVQRLSHRATRVEARAPVVQVLTALGATPEQCDRLLQQAEPCLLLEELLSSDPPALKVGVDEEGQLYCEVPRCEAAGGRFDRLAALALQLQDMGLAGATTLLGALCLGAHGSETHEARLLPACGKALLDKQSPLLSPQGLDKLHQRVARLVADGKLGAEWKTCFDEAVRSQADRRYQHRLQRRLTACRERVLSWLPELGHQTLDDALVQGLQREQGATPKRLREHCAQWEDYLCDLVSVPSQCPPWEAVEAMVGFAARAFPEQHNPVLLANLNLLHALHQPEQAHEALSRLWSQLETRSDSRDEVWKFQGLASVLQALEGIDARQLPEHVRRLRQNLPSDTGHADAMERRLRAWWLRAPASPDPAAALQRLEALVATEALETWSDAERAQLVACLTRLPPQARARLLKDCLLRVYGTGRSATHTTVRAWVRAFGDLADDRPTEKVLESLMRRLARAGDVDLAEGRPLVKGLLQALLSRDADRNAVHAPHLLLPLLVDFAVTAAAPVQALDDCIDLLRTMLDSLRGLPQNPSGPEPMRLDILGTMLCHDRAERSMGTSLKNLHHLFLLQAAWLLLSREGESPEPGAASLAHGHVMRPVYLGLVHTRLGQLAKRADTAQRWQATLKAYDELMSPDRASQLALAWPKWAGSGASSLSLLMEAMQAQRPPQSADAQAPLPSGAATNPDVG